MSSIVRIFGFLGNPFIILLGACLLIALPTVYWVYPDSEDLHTTLFSTFQFADALLSGRYPLWNTRLGFGTPLPFSNSLIPHPLAFFFRPDNLQILLFLFTWTQLFVGSICVFFVCRRFGAGGVSSIVGAVTFSLCSTTTYAIFIKVVPAYLLAWTLIPPIFLFVVYLADERTWRTVSVFKMLSLGLLTGVLLISGHVGTISGFALPLVVFAGLAAIRNPRSLIFLLVSACIALLMAADKAYLIWTEIQYSLSVFPDQERIFAEIDYDYFSFWSAFLKPLVPALSGGEFVLRNVRFGGATDPIWSKLLFVGPPYALLVISGVFVRFHQSRWYWPLAGGLAFSLLMVFLPRGALAAQMIVSGNVIFAAPLTFFAIILATLTLDEAGRRLGDRGNLFIQIVTVFQIGCLILGTLPYAFTGVLLNHRLGHVEVLDQAKPLADFLRSIRTFPSSRVYLSPEVTKKGPASIANWAGEANNALAILGVAQVQGYFKPGAMEEFEPDHAYGVSQIHSLADALHNKPMLDVLGIEFVLAAEGESWSESLQRVPEFDRRFELKTREGKRLVLLANPDVLPQAIALTVPSDEITLPVREGCGHRKLLCRDYTSLRAKVDSGVVDRIVIPTDGEIVVSLTPVEREIALFVTQAYRQGWQATADTGQPLAVRKAFGGFIVVDIPPGVGRISLEYAPLSRLGLSIVQWALLAVCGVALVVLATGMQVRASILRELGKSVVLLDIRDGPGMLAALRLPGFGMALAGWSAVLIVGYATAYLIFRTVLRISHHVILAESVFFGLFVSLLGFCLWRLWSRIPAKK